MCLCLPLLSCSCSFLLLFFLFALVCFLIHSGCMACVQDKNRKVAANSESRNVGGDLERAGDAEPEEPERSPKSKAGIGVYSVPVLRLDLKLFLSVKNCCIQSAPRQKPSPGSKICQTLFFQQCTRTMCFTSFLSHVFLVSSAKHKQNKAIFTRFLGLPLENIDMCSVLSNVLRSQNILYLNSCVFSPPVFKADRQKTIGRQSKISKKVGLNSLNKAWPFFWPTMQTFTARIFILALSPHKF